MNNNTFVMLLLFATLLFIPQIFSQGNNDDFVDDVVSMDGFNLNEIASAKKYEVVLDGIEINLNKRNRNVSRTRGNIEATLISTELIGASYFSKLFREFNEINGINYPFEINIVDKSVKDTRYPEICIVVDNNVVYKFRFLSKRTYLYAAVQESNKRLNQYLLENKKLYDSK